MPRSLLTNRFVENAKALPGKRSTDYTDRKCSGFWLRVTAEGRKTFYARYKKSVGRYSHIRLGDGGAISADLARELANDVLSRVARGEDPAKDRMEKQAEPTLAEFVKDRYLPFVMVDKKSWKSDETLLRNHVVPSFGATRLSNITVKEITDLTHGMRRRGYEPATCNRVLVLCRYLFNLAIKWGLLEDNQNPARAVAPFKVHNERQTFLSSDEVKALFAAVSKSENRDLPNIVAFLLLTGARKQEGFRAEWRDFDFHSRLWIIPETKSGRPRTIPMSDYLIALLQSLPSMEVSPYLFPNPKTGKPYNSIYWTWNKARIEAGLADVRMHDLRHSFASFLVNSGRSLYEVQRLLGHSHIKTTQRYAHLDQSTLTEAVNSIGGFVPIHREPQPPPRLIAAD